MAGNNSIQFLRGTSTQRLASTEALLPGQPFIETDTNKLYVGTGTGTTTTPLATASSINANPNLQIFWEGVAAKTVAVKAGDRSFIEIDGKIFPALCIDSDYNNGTTWQVNFLTYDQISSSPSWGSSKIFNYLNTQLINFLPDYITSHISSVLKSGTLSSLWLLSVEEIWGKSASGYTIDSNAYQFEYYNQLLGGTDITPTVDNSTLKSNNASWLRTSLINTVDNWGCIGVSGSLKIAPTTEMLSLNFCFILQP